MMVSVRYITVLFMQIDSCTGHALKLLYVVKYQLSNETGGYYGVFKAGGGGATHISTATGLLKDLVENKSAVICVAGGAGSNGGNAREDHLLYQSGGGLVGLGSINGDTGGTQDDCGPDGIKGGFGYGGNASGWGGSGGGGVPDWVHGGGGSGYIGGLINAASIDGGKTFPSPSGGTETGHLDNGYAKISWISPNL